MEPSATPEVTQPNEQDEAIYGRAFERIVRTMWVLLVVGSVVTLWRLGRVFAAGFLAGGVLALLNFYSLRRLVHNLAERVIGTAKPRGGGRIVLRFVLRYALFAAALYAIFRGSEATAYGIFVGLALPVPAMCAEAAYELVLTLRQSG